MEKAGGDDGGACMRAFRCRVYGLGVGFKGFQSGFRMLIFVFSVQGLVQI